MGGSDLTRPNTLAFRGKRENQSKVGGFVNQVASVEIWLLLSKFSLTFYGHVGINTSISNVSNQQGRTASSSHLISYKIIIFNQSNNFIKYMGGSDFTRPNTLVFRGERENQSKVGGFVNQVLSVKF